MVKFLMISLILLPCVCGAVLPLLKFKKRSVKMGCIGAVLFLHAVLTSVFLAAPEGEMTLFSMTDLLKVSLRNDRLSKLFMAAASYGFLLSGLFAFRYMEEEEREGSFPENSFFAFYLLTQGALSGMDLSANLVAMYFFFEMITLLSMPLVLHERTEEAVRAALKYLFYSIAGALLALCCIFFLARYAGTLDFVKGGSLTAEKALGHETLLSVVIFLGIIGFGTKAGMYPMHGWLPTAHPVAPAPASAVLSGVIAKAGVLAIIRIIFYAVGPEFLQGTWMQTVWLSLSLLTVFMGSMMAFREKVFKKRLAYSSVSQISYVLFGIFLMNADGVTGGLMQVLFHATVKIALFLTAGSVICLRGYRKVDELRGIGKEMPGIFGAFTLASLSLIGIPPFAGFVSKWYLAEGSLSSGIRVLSWLGPVILLVSALLTAGYLLPVSVNAFFPGKDFEAPAKKEGERKLLLAVPILILAGLSLLSGVFGGQIGAWIGNIISEMI